MARAGKVRGQTPKVAKQEKKKNPKGRAMKRIKYNRRFVNVGELSTLLCRKQCHQNTSVRCPSVIETKPPGLIETAACPN